MVDYTYADASSPGSDPTGDHGYSEYEGVFESGTAHDLAEWNVTFSNPMSLINQALAPYNYFNLPFIPQAFTNAMGGYEPSYLGDWHLSSEGWASDTQYYKYYENDRTGDWFIQYWDHEPDHDDPPLYTEYGGPSHDALSQAMGQAQAAAQKKANQTPPDEAPPAQSADQNRLEEEGSGSGGEYSSSEQSEPPSPGDETGQAQNNAENRAQERLESAASGNSTEVSPSSQGGVSIPSTPDTPVSGVSQPTAPIAPSGNAGAPAQSAWDQFVGVASQVANAHAQLSAGVVQAFVVDGFMGSVQGIYDLAKGAYNAATQYASWQMNRLWSSPWKVLVDPWGVGEGIGIAAKKVSELTAKMQPYVDEISSLPSETIWKLFIGDFDAVRGQVSPTLLRAAELAHGLSSSVYESIASNLTMDKAPGLLGRVFGMVLYEIVEGLVITGITAGAGAAAVGAKIAKKLTRLSDLPGLDSPKVQKAINDVVGFLQSGGKVDGPSKPPATPHMPKSSAELADEAAALAKKKCDEARALGKEGGCFVPGTLVSVTSVALHDKSISDFLLVTTNGICPSSEPGVSEQSFSRSVDAKEYASLPIETISLGSRVVASNPHPWEFDSRWEEPESDSWRTIHLEMYKQDGSVIDSQLLRPVEVVESLNLHPGRMILIHADELDVAGMALIKSVSNAPSIAQGTGRVVIGRFMTREVNELIRLTLSTGDVVEGTPNHPLWSVDLNDWQAMEMFEAGDYLAGHEENVLVLSKERVEHTTPVYNLEVHGEHVYHLTQAGILAHNTYPEDTPNPPPTKDIVPEPPSPPKADDIVPEVKGVEPTTRYTLKDRLNSPDDGAHKEVFSVMETDKIAVGILKKGASPAILAKERALLKQLEEAGLPVMKNHEITEYNGRPAIVMDRYALGSKKIVKYNSKIRDLESIGGSVLLNEKSISDLMAIKSKMMEKNIKIDELQFLIGEDGSVVIADPLDVYPQPPTSRNKKMIDMLIRKAIENTRI
ncbi:hypothetical protein Plim_1444 [Planctopirus limnophila DSM 3776]|uniref:Type III secretion system effector HopBF1-like domain-containing protein n=1 Tax=Planctopirus limnophila (strain ATCC 43296 / DSM 3776 / IFAM 1008 / Mu 290) TaxID=521674 RepID=D5SVZ3_PLAL2|nr:hypothetical protein [Planctopirus limnophila]ADG67278.1 hypothetical protein Plim_1444 [Planctopirus limnophila DSM 3776]